MMPTYPADEPPFVGPAGYSGDVHVVECGLCSGWGFDHDTGHCARCRGAGWVCVPVPVPRPQLPLHAAVRWLRRVNRHREICRRHRARWSAGKRARCST
jgi:hypothetical protein